MAENRKACYFSVLHVWCLRLILFTRTKTHKKGERKREEKGQGHPERQRWCGNRGGEGKVRRHRGGWSLMLSRLWSIVFAKPDNPLLLSIWTLVPKTMATGDKMRACVYICHCVLWLLLFIDQKQRYVVRLVGLSYQLSGLVTKREVVGPSTRSAPLLIPSNIYTHTLLVLLKYN